MSYILDALKKMEHEKAKKKGAGGIASVSGELFRSEKLKPQKGNIWKIGAAIMLVVVLTACVTWYLLREKTPVKTVKTATPIVAPPVQQVQQQESVATPAPVPAPVVSPAPPAAISRPETPVASRVATSTPADDEGRRASRRNSAKAVQRPESEGSVAAPADIKVSGIAWQDERAARRAVVNGFLLKEGAVVAGAKIVEILPEKIRFSMNGKTFELSMHSSAVTGGAK
jgi:general secretion pathway protein B